MRTRSVLTLVALSVSILLFAACAGSHPHLTPSTGLVKARAKAPTTSDRWYRMELTSGQRIGFMHLRLQPAPKGKEGMKAAYLVTTQGLFAMGPVEMSITEEALLDEDFAVVAVRSEKNGRMSDQEPSREESTLTRTKDGWDRTAGETRSHAPIDVPYYDVTPGLALLLERLPLTDKAKWTVPSLAWKEKQKGEAARARTISLEVRAALFQHDGGEVDGFTVTLSKDDKPGEDVVHVDQSGRMLRLTTSDATIRLVATTEEAAKKDEPPPPIEASTPQYPLSRYLEVLAGLAEPEVLDEIIDWDAVLIDISQKLRREPPPPEAREEAVAQIKKELHGQARGELDADMIRLAVGMTIVSMEGDRATLSGPGGGTKVFVAEKRGDTWVLISLPR